MGGDAPPATRRCLVACPPGGALLRGVWLHLRLLAAIAGVPVSWLCSVQSWTSPTGRTLSVALYSHWPAVLPLPGSSCHLRLFWFFSFAFLSFYSEFSCLLAALVTQPPEPALGVSCGLTCSRGFSQALGSVLWQLTLCVPDSHAGSSPRTPELFRLHPGLGQAPGSVADLIVSGLSRGTQMGKFFFLVF